MSRLVLRVVRVAGVAQTHHLGVNLAELSSNVGKTVVKFLLAGDQTARQQHPRRAERHRLLFGCLGRGGHDLGSRLRSSRRCLSGNVLDRRFLCFFFCNFSRSRLRDRPFSNDLLFTAQIFNCYWKPLFTRNPSGSK